MNRYLMLYCKSTLLGTRDLNWNTSKIAPNDRLRMKVFLDKMETKQCKQFFWCSNLDLMFKVIGFTVRVKSIIQNQPHLTNFLIS